MTKAEGSPLVAPPVEVEPGGGLVGGGGATMPEPGGKSHLREYLYDGEQLRTR